MVKAIPPDLEYRAMRITYETKDGHEHAFLLKGSTENQARAVVEQLILVKTVCAVALRDEKGLLLYCAEEK